MEKKEINDIMSKPKSANLVNKYKEIWLIATGERFTSCLCGGGYERLYRLCVNYNNKIKRI